jgi:hypothetical protein
LVSGDVQSKIAVYDEKIKTAQDNIDVNRKALKQLDEAVDQVMGRSTSETGADKAVAIRKSQAKERTRLLAEIATEQKTIAGLREERAPIAAEVRKVEAEVGPIKYIAAFVYGDNPDANVLEKAVTWVIIIIVSVFDPLAVILLLASQYSFQWFRKEEAEGDSPEKIQETEQSTVTEIKPEVILPVEEVEVVKESTVEEPGEPFVKQAKYPASEDEIEELNQAIEQAKFETFDKDVDTTVVDTDIVQDGDLERPGDYLTPNNRFAPPGTPGEAWSAPVKTEQQAESNIDKIYKTSREELAKQQRSRGWFQAVFPKKND